MLLLWLESEHLWLCICHISQGNWCQNEALLKEIAKYADIRFGDKEKYTFSNLLLQKFPSIREDGEEEMKP